MLGVAIVLAAIGSVVAVGVLDEDREALALSPTDFEVRGDGDSAAIVPIHGFRAGEALVAGLEVFSAPRPAFGTLPTMVAANPTHEGFPLVVAVIDESSDGDWLNVRLPQRPNGSTGWVRAADLRLWENPNRIEVSVSQRTLRVYRGDTTEVLFETLVAVGAPGTPTPLGDFFIDIVNPLYGHPTYGWGQLSVSGFSDVLQRFGGGIGQIAIHGWNNDNVVGDDVSNGCVRMRNDDIAIVSELAPLGTPVEIVE